MVDTGAYQDRAAMADGLQGGLTSDERHVSGRAPLPLARGGETDTHQGTPVSIRHMDVIDVVRSGGRGNSQDLGGSTPQHLSPNG